MNSNRKLLEKILKRRTGKEYINFHGRASLSLTLLLKALSDRFANRILALPSFICHSVVSSTLAAGWTPLFCDIDKRSGLVSEDEWQKAYQMGCRVFLFAHLFGNQIDRDLKNQDFIHSDVFIIEDACQAFGSYSDSSSLKFYSDAVLFSFGHTKIIDVGHGGALLYNDSSLFQKIDKLENDFVLLSASSINIKEREFRDSFYHRKDKFYQYDDSDCLKGLVEDYVPLLNVKLDESYISLILEEDELLDSKLEARINNFKRYKENLSEHQEINILELKEGSIPWRFSFYLKGISKKIQNDLSEKLRRKGLDVSNWYLPAHLLTGSNYLTTGSLLNTKELSQSIFQFWLDEKMSDFQIDENCQRLLEFI